MHTSECIASKLRVTRREAWHPEFPNLCYTVRELFVRFNKAPGRVRDGSNSIENI